MISDNMLHIYELFLSKLQYFFSDEKIAKVVLYSFYVLFIICIFQNANLLWKYSSWQPLKPISKDLTEVKSLDVSDIAQKHIFGVSSKPGATLANARETKLPIQLKGVVAPQNPKLGSAILLVDNKEQSYRVGDKIVIGSNKVILEYIFRDKVFINNNEILEYILYPKLEDRLKNPSDSQSPLFNKSLIKFKNSNENNFLPEGNIIEDGNSREEEDSHTQNRNLKKPRNPIDIREHREMLKNGKIEKKEILSRLKKRLKNNYN